MSSQYSYTISKDDETGKQLMYTPKQVAKILVNYTYKKWFFDFNERYVGKVFTTTTNTQNLEAYWLSSINLKRKLFNQKLGLGIQIDNLFNKNYQVVATRPMPNRNYAFNINYKF